MTKTLLINLFKTFVLSVIISIALSSLYYTVILKLGDYTKALPVIISGVFYLNGILLIMSVPSLFASNPTIWNNPAWRLFLFFAGPVAFVITNLISPKAGPTGVVYHIAGIVFLLTSAVFYFLLTRKIKAIA